MGRDLRLVLQQVKYQNKIFWRTPVSAFFTIVFPLMLLLLFTAIFGNDEIEALGVSTAQFYAPALAVFGVASATYTNLAVTTAISRDDGILKKVRGTPLPPWVYIAGRVVSAVWIALIAALVMMSAGVVLFDVEVAGSTLPAAGISFLVGAAAFAALGLLVAAVVPNGDSAPAVANATLLPLAFVSDIFIVTSESPEWIQTIGDLFPLKHFVASFAGAFNPTLSGSGFGWRAETFEYAVGAGVVVMAAWGIGGAVLAVRYFKWDPQGSRVTGRRRTQRKRNHEKELA